MANISRPAGLVPLEYIDGSNWSGKGRMYFIQQSDPNAYAIGDPVVRTNIADGNGVCGVVLATVGDGNKVLGPIIGMGGLVYGGPGAVPGALETTIIPATKTKAFYVLIADDPAIIFSIQEGGAGTVLAAAQSGSNINFVAAANTGFVSGWMIDNNTVGTGITKQLNLMGLVQSSDNAFGISAKWKVRINNHSYAAGQVGV